MADHITRVREQAEKASREAYDFNGVRGHDSRNGTRRKAFTAGAVWLAGRLTRENIARRLAAHSTGGVCAPNDPSLAWETWLSEADAILALLRGGEGR